MKKARITFNGVEKIVEITEEFHTEYRVLGEMSDIWSEESKLMRPPAKYESVPMALWPKEIQKQTFEDAEVDIAFDNMSVKYEESLIKVIEEAFGIVVDADIFLSESYNPTEEDEKNGIVIVEVGNDV